MLFLHALLFSLLATSTLAIPVPGSSSSRPSQVLDEEPIKGSAKPSRADGLWFRRGSYLPGHWEHPVHVVEISGDRLTVLSPTLPKKEDMPKNFYYQLFHEGLLWKRVTKVEDLREADEKASEKTVPEVNAEYLNDRVKIEFETTWLPLKIQLYKNGVTTDAPLKYGGILLEGTEVDAIRQKAEGHINT